MTKGTNNKKDAQGKETRKRILMAAVKLFARQGYHKTTIADIAQAIHLTSGAIFHHFPNKEALLDAVIEWLERGIHIYSDLIERRGKGSLHLFHEIIDVMCDHYKRNPEATICLAALATEFAGSSHPVEARLKEVYEVFVNAFGSCLADHPGIADPKAAAIAFVGSVQGIAIQGLLREGEHSINQLAKAFLSLMVDW